jgi:tRNA(Arg) A34 adenosine deaminase TadA
VYVPNAHDFLMMASALEQAELAGFYKDNAIGCVYVAPSGETSATQTREMRDKNLQAHAEQLGYQAVRSAAGRDLSKYTVYATTEPCFACAHLFDKGSLGRLFIAASKEDAPDFFRNRDTLHHIWQTTNRTLKVISGLLCEEALDIKTRYPRRV